MDQSQPKPPSLPELRHRIGARRPDLTRLGVERVAIIGSCAREEQRAGSDVDLMVALKSGHGYFDLAEMQALLETDLAVPVQVILESALEPDSPFRRVSVRVF